MARLLVLTFAAATLVFCAVQDRVTAAAARRYVAIQQAAAAGLRQPTTIDAVMRPAIRDSVRQGLLWGGAVAAAGFGGAALSAWRTRR